MSLTFKMFLPVIIISVITIISMIIAKIVTDEDGWVLGIFFVGALLFATVFSITLSHTVKVCGFTKKIFYKTYKESRFLPAFFFLQKGQIYRKNFHI